MTFFVDTSAFLAVMDRDDGNHPQAKREWNALISSRVRVVTTSYVLVETCALIQRRLGLDALRAFHTDVHPLMQVEWVGESEHESGMSGVFANLRKDLSLVDCVSFSTMRRLGIDYAFAFDKHFVEQGFHCIPVSV